MKEWSYNKAGHLLQNQPLVRNGIKVKYKQQ